MLKAALLISAFCVIEGSILLLAPQLVRKAMGALIGADPRALRPVWTLAAIGGLLAIGVAALSTSQSLSFAAGLLAVALLGYPMLALLVPAYSQVGRRLLEYSPGQLRFIGMTELSCSSLLALLFWYLLSS